MQQEFFFVQQEKKYPITVALPGKHTADTFRQYALKYKGQHVKFYAVKPWIWVTPEVVKQKTIYPGDVVAISASGRVMKAETSPHGMPIGIALTGVQEGGVVDVSICDVSISA